MPHQIGHDSFGFLVADLSRLIRAEFERHVNEAGLAVTAGEARTLVHAARAGEVRQGVLAERMGVEAMTLTGYLDRLEARGLIERRPDPCDRRAKLVGLTAASEAMLEQIKTTAAGVHAEASQNIAEADWDKLLDLLKVVRTNLEAARSTPDRKQGRAA
jgi:DNA-binding MarR family transcriptional regulator